MTAADSRDQCGVVLRAMAHLRSTNPSPKVLAAIEQIEAEHTPTAPPADEPVRGNVYCGLVNDHEPHRWDNTNVADSRPVWFWCNGTDPPADEAREGLADTWHCDICGSDTHDTIVHDDKPAHIDWWWTEEGRAAHVERQVSEARAAERERIAAAIEAEASRSSYVDHDTVTEAWLSAASLARTGTEDQGVKTDG